MTEGCAGNIDESDKESRRAGGRSDIQGVQKKGLLVEEEMFVFLCSVAGENEAGRDSTRRCGLDRVEGRSGKR